MNLQLNTRNQTAQLKHRQRTKTDVHGQEVSERCSAPPILRDSQARVPVARQGSCDKASSPVPHAIQKTGLLECRGSSEERPRGLLTDSFP